MEIFVNNVWATLASPIDASQTSMTLTAGHGAKFGTIGAGNQIRIVFLDAALAISEVAYMTAISGDVATIVRGQDGTTGAAQLTTGRIEARIGKSTMESITSWVSSLFAAITGSASQVFSVGTATAPAHAVRLDQLQSIYPLNYLTGSELSTAGGTGTFGIAAGASMDSTNAAMMAVATAYTKTQSAWAVGTGNGGWDGTGAAPTTAAWWHVYRIRRPDTGVVDYIFSLSATAPTLPANYTEFRRLGSMKSIVTTGYWTAFLQTGDLFKRLVDAADVAVSNPGSSAVLATVSVPTGLKVRWLGSVGIRVAGDYVKISDPDTTDSAATTSNFTIYGGGASNTGVYAECQTNTSAQIRYRANAGSGGMNMDLNTSGWIDTRGK